jgi:hypothetical protein
MRRFAGNQEMENNKMKMHRAPLALLLGTFTVFGCWQKLDEHASDGVQNVNIDPAGGIGAKFPTETTTPEIGQTAAENGDPNTFATSGCDKDKTDTQTVLKNDCENCHQVGANGNFQGVDDIMTLINKAASVKYTGQKFIVPGDPSHSLIFQRVLAGEMPPPSSDVTVIVPRPSISDMSVLQQWIMCLSN